MKIFVLDVSGDRHWDKWRNAEDLLATKATPTANDIVFIHTTDLLQGHRKNPRDIPKSKRTSLFSKVETFRDAPIGLGQAALILISGNPALALKHEQEIELIFKGHERSRIHFFQSEVPHGIDKDGLEKRLGAFVDGLSQSFDIRGEALEATFELNTAFRLLWQMYVLANTNSADVPQILKSLKERIGICTLGRNYWAPLLTKEGRLDERLARSAEKDLLDVFIALSGETNWEPLSANTIVKQYREKWFATLMATRSSKP